MKQAENTFDEIDGITIRPRGKAKTVQKEPNKQDIDVMALIDDTEVEDRSEVMSIRITPSARRKIEEIWLSQRQKRKKVKESTIAAEILMKVLERY